MEPLGYFLAMGVAAFVLVVGIVLYLLNEE